MAEAVLAEAQEKHAPKPIATLLRDEVAFWPAENRHQDYYNLNKGKGYCRLVIHPKLKKVKHGKFQPPTTNTTPATAAKETTTRMDVKAPVDENALNQ